MSGVWRRLHPLSPMVRSGRAVLAVLTLAGLSASGVVGSSAGPRWYDVALPAIVAIVAIVDWYVTRWKMDGVTLRIETGLLRRDSRQLPIARIQAVDLVRPFPSPDARPGRTAGPAGRVQRRRRAARLPFRTSGRGAAGAPAGGPSRARPGHPAPGGTDRDLGPGRAAGRVGGNLRGRRGVLGCSGRGWSFAAVFARRPACRRRIPGVVADHRRRGSSGGTFPPSTASPWPPPGRGPHPARAARHRGRDHSGAADSAVRMVEPLLWRPLHWCRLEVDVAGHLGRDSAEGTHAVRKARATVYVDTAGCCGSRFPTLFPPPPIHLPSPLHGSPCTAILHDPAAAPGPVEGAAELPLPYGRARRRRFAVAVAGEGEPGDRPGCRWPRRRACGWCKGPLQRKLGLAARPPRRRAGVSGPSSGSAARKRPGPW